MEPETDSMTGIWELCNHPKHINFFQFCNSYIEAAFIYAKSIAAQSRKPAYSESCVIQFLAYHATELFLKGGILKSSSSGVPASHNIYELHKTYQSFYANTEASFDMPFTIEYLGENRDQNFENYTYKELGHLLFRYPVNKDGDDWRTVVGFTLNDYIEFIENLKNDFNILEKKLNNINITTNP